MAMSSFLPFHPNRTIVEKFELAKSGVGIGSNLFIKLLILQILPDKVWMTPDGGYRSHLKTVILRHTDFYDESIFMAVHLT
jgi:hypothetical protein